MTRPRQLVGRLLYRSYYAPLAGIRRIFSEGGLRAAWRTSAGRRQMEAAARTLPRPTGLRSSNISPFVLTGTRFWYQSAFCLYSLSHYSGVELSPVFMDDGTLRETERIRLAEIFPRARFVEPAAALARLNRYLPREKFPVLRERWENYPNLRKLIDPHLGSTGWKLVLDSDLLFFRAANFLVAWATDPRQPLHAVDSETSYGYSPPLLETLAGAPLAPRVNVGLCGLRSEELDWSKIERWCAQLQAAEGKHYYLEQALVAMLLAGRTCSVAPERDYVTLPVYPENSDCTAVMHHYVATSKRAYFERNWRRVCPR
jgi:hypothetical protein